MKNYYVLGKVTREVMIRIDAETEEEALFKANSLSIDEVELLNDPASVQSVTFNFTSASDSDDLGEEF